MPARSGRRGSVGNLKATDATVHGTAVDVSDKAALKARVASSADALGGIDKVFGNVSALAVADDEYPWMAGFDSDMMHPVRLVNVTC